VAYTHRLGPNSTKSDNDAWACAATKRPEAPCVKSIAFSTAYWAARSLHVGGVNGCRIDGSVQFISEDVDGDAWIALGSINGEETTTAL
jgi:hypothetical protein